MGIPSPDLKQRTPTKFLWRYYPKLAKMSESHFDKYEHYNYDQDKAMYSGGSGKQRSKLEVAQHTNQHNPAGHERKTATARGQSRSTSQTLHILYFICHHHCHFRVTP